MARRTSRFSVPAAIVLTAFVGLAIQGIGGVPAVEAKDKAVTVVEFAFEPKTVTIKQHETVTWLNTGVRDHTVTADDGAFDSGALSTGDSFGNVFDTAGTFTYRCTIHPGQMRGTVIVKAVAATPVPSGSQPPTPPPGTLPPNFRTPVPVPTPEPSASEPPGASVAPSADVSPEPSPEVDPAGSSGPLLLGIGVLVALAVGGLLLAGQRRRRVP